MSSGGMNVDFDKWGTPLQGSDMVPVIEKIDGEDVVVGHIEDGLRFIMEEDEHKITKADIIAEIEGWKNDDGTYGGEDEIIFVAYDDGTFYSSDMQGGRNGYRDKFKKTGIIGATVSTADYEMVWGGERNRAGDIVPYKTWVAPYDESQGKTGKSNSYSGYKVVGEYWVRDKITHNNKHPNGRIYTKHEIIRKSKVRKVD